MFHLETKCHSGCSEHLDVALGGRLEGVETLLGRSEHGRFVKAPTELWQKSGSARRQALAQLGVYPSWRRQR